MIISDEKKENVVVRKLNGRLDAYLQRVSRK